MSALAARTLRHGLLFCARHPVVAGDRQGCVTSRHEAPRGAIPWATRVPFCELTCSGESPVAHLMLSATPECPANAGSTGQTVRSGAARTWDPIIRSDAMSAETPNSEYACLQELPTGEADAGTRTPDPIITRYSRCPRQGAWLSQILFGNPLRVQRVCNRVRQTSNGVGQAVSGLRCARCSTRACRARNVVVRQPDQAESLDDDPGE
jgi:hypothetical protein